VKANRNDPCPCGSGKKYKNCHAETEPKRNPLLLAVVALIIVVGGAIAGRAYFSPEEEAGIAVPDGPPPPGKVWSMEHGHWHDAPTSNPVRTLTRDRTPQPPGDPPPGKEWSTEHSHWHDIPEGDSLTAGSSAPGDTVP